MAFGPERFDEQVQFVDAKGAKLSGVGLNLEDDS